MIFGLKKLNRLIREELEPKPDRWSTPVINEVCNRFYYVSEHSKNKADDYNITLIFKEKEVVFSASEFIDIIDQGIIRELP